MTDSAQQATDLVGPAAVTARTPGGRAGRYAGRALIRYVVPVVLLVVAVAGSLATYRAVEAAEGHGTNGYFVDVSNARGEFQLPDGQVTRPHVTFADPPAGLSPGTVLPALDTGDATYVFTRHGSRHWITDTGILAFVLVAFGAWLWFVPLRLRHQRRAELEPVPGAGPHARGTPAATTVYAAAAQPAWSTSSIALLNGDISTRRINTALKTARNRAGYPLLVTVGIQLTDADRAMNPVSGESGQLATITETVTRLVTGHGVLAASVADSTGWMFMIYTGTTDWLAEFESQMRSEVSDHLIAFGARRDRRWQVYRDLWRTSPHAVGTRQRLVLLAVIPLVFAWMVAARYGLAWAAGVFAAVASWWLLVAFGKRGPLTRAQRAHPGLTALALTGVFWTLLFPLGAIIVHPSSPVVCAVGAAVLSAVVVAAMWPAQRRYYDRIRASAALQQPAGPAA
jgi:hypothetical protein